MRKSSVCLLLLSLVTMFIVSNAQTRARRVGQNAPDTKPVDPSGEPSASLPSHPPVLGGANRTSNGRSNEESRGATTGGPEEIEAGDVVRVNTTLVTVPVSVTDRDGRYIPNLGKEDFRLWEDGIEQQVAFFASVDKPFSVVLMLDTSGSTRFKLEEIQDAAIAFVNQLHPDDRVMVVSFDDGTRILTDFTSDRYRLQQAIRRTRPGEGTRLYDALDLVINQKLAQISGRKVVVLFTDGVDTTSKHASYESNVRDAEELDALIYPVEYETYLDLNGGGGSWPGPGRRSRSGVGILIDIFGGGIGMPGGRSGRGGGGPGSSRHDYERADRYLHELADRTGGRLYNADSTQNLSAAFGNVAEELRRQYSLGYYPKLSGEHGQRRQIRVRVNEPNLAVRTRDSYIFNPSGNGEAPPAPPQESAPVLRKKLSGTTAATDNLNTR